MPVRRRAGALAAVLLLAGCLGPPRAAADDFDTDRPDVTEGPAPLAPGRLQLEAGWTQDRFGRATRQDTFGEVLLRVGLVRQLELRAFPPGWGRARGPGSDASGFTPPGVGLKWRLTPVGAARAVALIADAGLPGGEGAFERRGVDAELIAVGESDVAGADLTANLVASREGATGDWGGAATLSGEVELAPRLAAYAEAYDVRDPGADAAAFADAGLLVRVAHWTQVDGRFGLRLGGAPHTTFGFGLARRW